MEGRPEPINLPNFINQFPYATGRWMLSYVCTVRHALKNLYHWRYSDKSDCAAVLADIAANNRVVPIIR